MTMITIRNRFTDAIILERDTIKGADLRYADLSYADLRHADLSYADLEGADLSCADLRYADLSCADLTEANLSQANLVGADLVGADLRYAILRDANLTGADLVGADLRGADLRAHGIYIYTLDRDLIIAHASQIQIGCEKHSIDHWLEHYKEIGKKNGYTEKQVNNYCIILNMLTSLNNCETI